MRYEIVADTDPFSPRENCNLGTILYVSNRYVCGDECVSSERIAEVMRSKDKIWLPVYAYVHSGVMLSTKPFSCPWDSGQLGCIYVSREDILEEWNVQHITENIREQVLSRLRSEIDEYSKFLNGEVYGFRILDDAGNEVDSCGGFYGREHAEEAAKEALLHAKGMRVLALTATL